MKLGAQTGRTCKYFLLLPSFFWNGAIIIAKCGFFSKKTALVEVKQVVYQPHNVLTTQGEKGLRCFQLVQSLQVSDQTFSTDSLA